jgi:hypothetical protein
MLSNSIGGKMTDNFHTRAIAADYLQATIPTPSSSSEWVKLLKQIDEAQDVAARKAVTDVL